MTGLPKLDPKVVELIQLVDKLIDQILTQLHTENNIVLVDKDKIKKELLREILPCLLQCLKKAPLHNTKLLMESFKQYCLIHILSEKPAVLAKGLKPQLDHIKSLLRAILSGDEKAHELSHLVRRKLGEISAPLKEAEKDDPSVGLLWRVIAELALHMKNEEKQHTSPAADTEVNEIEKLFIKLFHMTLSGVEVEIDSDILNEAAIEYVGAAMGGNLQNVNPVERSAESTTNPRTPNPFPMTPSPDHHSK